MSNYQTLEDANYSYMEYRGNFGHILKNNETGEHELFIASKNHAGWGIIYKNTHLEFICTVYTNPNK